MKYILWICAGAGLILSFIHRPGSSSAEPSSRRDTAVIAISFSSNDISGRLIYFYASATDRKPVHVLAGYDSIAVLWEMKGSWLVPYEVLGSSRWVFFRCTGASADRYRIIVSERTLEEAWIAIDKHMEANSWNEYLGGGDAVVQVHGLKKTPSDDADSISFNGCHKYELLEMRGDWVKLSTSYLCSIYEDDPKVELQEGWARWRRGSEILLYKTYAE
jgi:hypothetical protein